MNVNEFLDQSNTALLIGIAGVAVVLVLVAALLLRRRRASRRQAPGALTLGDRLLPSRRRLRAEARARREREVLEGVAAGLAIVSRESELRETQRAASDAGIPFQRVARLEEDAPSRESAEI